MLTLTRKYAEKVIAGMPDDSHMIELLVMYLGKEYIELRVDGDLQDYCITIRDGIRLKVKTDFLLFRLFPGSEVSFALIGTAEVFTVALSAIDIDQSCKLVFADSKKIFKFVRSELLPVSY